MSSSVENKATVVSIPSKNSSPSGSSSSSGKQRKKGSRNSPQKRKTKQDEGLLRDVLLELDRERSTRAELEARVRVLEQDLHTAKRQQKHNSAAPNASDYIRLQAEKDGYLQILDALLQDKPAFQAHKQSNNNNSTQANSTTNKPTKTLPLHVLRMLEVIPWDPRARPHLFGEEQLWEWQMYSSDKSKSWNKEMRYFPQDPFKSLSCIIPRPNQTVGEAPTASSPPKQQHAVLTNLQITRRLNIDQGYPLPKDGGVWKWVGGWRIEKNQNTDETGWSYSNSVDVFDDNSYYGELRLPEKGTPNLVKRRRKWTRLRVLVDYPQASAMTKEYLKLVAEKAELDVSVEKLSSQLVETKMKLTTLEAEHMAYKEEMELKVKTLERDLSEKNRIMQLVEDIPASTSSSASVAKESVKELRSAVTQWVSNTVSKRQASGSEDGNTVTSEDEEAEEEALVAAVATNAITKQLMFESLKEKGGGLLGKIKLKGGDELIERIKQNGNSILASRKDKQSAPGANSTQPVASPTATTTTTTASNEATPTVAKIDP